MIPSSPARTRRSVVAVAIAMAMTVLPIGAQAAPPDTPVILDGGGWGHGIGMPQWAAYGMAQEGWKWRDILQYWYDGAGFADASAVSGVPDLIRVGIDHVKVGGGNQYRPFRWLDFEAVNGQVRICLDGETGETCSFAAEPGVAEVWRMAWETGTGCILTENGAVRHSGPCGIHLEWDDQPNTRVAFPELQQNWALGDFARGRILFEAPKTSTWNGTTHTGFHIVVQLTLDEYMYGLAEVPASWPQQSLRAQAVAGRTYAAWKARSGVRGDCSCHLFWDTRHQAYRGWHNLNEGNPDHGHKWRTAVDKTSGKVVVHPNDTNNIAETYYFSSSGGGTENVWEIWGPDTPSYRAKYAYLHSRPDTWSELAPSNAYGVRWTRSTTAGAIASSLGLDELVSMSIEGRRESGSPDRITVVGIVDGLLEFDSYTGNQLVGKLGLTSHYIHSISGLDPLLWPVSVNRATAAAAAAQETYPAGAGVVFLAYGPRNSHTLALEPVAAAAGAPILFLEKGGSMLDVTRDELVRLDPDQVLVVAGSGLVPGSAMQQIRSVVPDAAVSRLVGSNRYKTPIVLTKAVFGEEVDVVYVTTGNATPHALLTAHTATAHGAPMVLVRSDRVPKAVRNELQRLAPDRIVVIGSEDEVSPAVFATLANYAGAIDRVAEDGKYQLSVELSEAAYPGGADTVYLAIGRNHPWPLLGAMHLPGEPGPVLTLRRDSIPAAVLAELERLAPSKIVLLGSPAKAKKDLLAALAPLIGP